jgi:hypothetical protein
LEKEKVIYGGACKSNCEMEVPIKTNQHYRNKRGDIYTLEHHNDDIVLLHDGHHYRLENKQYFKSLLDEGEFELFDGNITDSKVEIPLKEIGQIGDITVESMERKGYTTPVDIERTSDEKLLECHGLGEAGLSNIYDWIESNTGSDTVEI